MDLTQYKDSASGLYNIPYTTQAGDTQQNIFSRFGVGANNITYGGDNHTQPIDEANITPGSTPFKQGATIYLRVADPNVAKSIIAPNVGPRNVPIEGTTTYVPPGQPVVNDATTTGPNAEINKANAARVAAGQNPDYSGAVQNPTPAPTAQPAQPANHQNIFNPTTGQYGYQVPGGALQPGWQWATGGSTPVPSPNQTPTATPTPNATVTTPQPQGATSGTSVQPPTTALQPGSSGPEVQALQNYLVSLGFLTPEQVATGPGIYGPQTTAAVKAFQQTFGVDNSTGPGFWGPHSIATANQLLAATSGSTPSGQAPGVPDTGAGVPSAPANLSSILASAGIQTTAQTSLSDIVQQLSKAYNLTGINSRLTTLDDKLAKETININDDPWISEVIREKKIKTLTDAYTTEKSNLLDELKNENTIVGQAITLYNAEQSNQEKLISDALTNSIQKLNATNSSQTPDIKEYNLAKSEGYTGTFTDYQKQAANLKISSSTKKTSTPGSTPGLLTQTQINTGATRLGVPNTEFVKLDPQVQTFFAGTTGNTFVNAVSAMTKGGTNAPSYNDILDSINASVQPEVVKAQMTKYLDAVAGHLKSGSSSSSSSGTSFWDKLVNLIS